MDGVFMHREHIQRYKPLGGEGIEKKVREVTQPHTDFGYDSAVQRLKSTDEVIPRGEKPCSTDMSTAEAGEFRMCVGCHEDP